MAREERRRNRRAEIRYTKIWTAGKRERQERERGE